MLSFSFFSFCDYLRRIYALHLLVSEEKIIEVEIIDRVEEFYSDGKETFAISTGDYSINLTIFHIIPYYRAGELIIDNCGTVDVGDELIIIDEDELAVSREKVISIEEGVTDNQVVYQLKAYSLKLFILGQFKTLRQNEYRHH